MWKYCPYCKTYKRMTRVYQGQNYPQYTGFLTFNSLGCVCHTCGILLAKASVESDRYPSYTESEVLDLQSTFDISDESIGKYLLGLSS